MFVLAIGGLVLLMRWRTVPGIVWTGYHCGESSVHRAGLNYCLFLFCCVTVFITFEFLLFNEGAYPLLFVLMTTLIGSYLAYR